MREAIERERQKLEDAALRQQDIDSESNVSSLADPTINIHLKPFQTNLLLERSKLHENLLYEK